MLLASRKGQVSGANRSAKPQWTTWTTKDGLYTKLSGRVSKRPARLILDTYLHLHSMHWNFVKIYHTVSLPTDTQVLFNISDMAIMLNVMWLGNGYPTSENKSHIFWQRRLCAWWSHFLGIALVETQGKSQAPFIVSSERLHWMKGNTPLHLAWREPPSDGIRSNWLFFVLHADLHSRTHTAIFSV